MKKKPTRKWPILGRRQGLRLEFITAASLNDVDGSYIWIPTWIEAESAEKVLDKFQDIIRLAIRRKERLDVEKNPLLSLRKVR